MAPDDDDDDMGAMFRARNEASKVKRAANRETSAQALFTAGIKFDSKNDGAHLIVDGYIDFWPGTGLWIGRKPINGRKEGRGVNNLIKQIQKRASK